MSDPQRLTRAERELELALAAIRPASMHIDRDRLMFKAGQIAGRRRLRFWMAAAATLAVCACLALALRPKPRTVERIVHVAPPVVEPAPVTEVTGGVPYIEMRQAIAEGELDPDTWDDRAKPEPRPRSLFLGLITRDDPEQLQGDTE